MKRGKQAAARTSEPTCPIASVQLVVPYEVEAAARRILTGRGIRFDEVDAGAYGRLLTVTADIPGIGTRTYSATTPAEAMGYALGIALVRMLAAGGDAAPEAVEDDASEAVENVCPAYPCPECLFNREEWPEQYNPICVKTGARGLPREIGGEG